MKPKLADKYVKEIGNSSLAWQIQYHRKGIILSKKILHY